MFMSNSFLSFFKKCLYLQGLNRFLLLEEFRLSIWNLNVKLYQYFKTFFYLAIIIKVKLTFWKV